MAPEGRVEELRSLRKQPKNARKAAVMALFYPKNNDNTHLLLIHRKTYAGVHSNQIGFPGGKAESSDIDLLDTALRETEEEVGVVRQDVKVIKTLSKIYIPPSNFEVQPFIGLLANPTDFLKQEAEVEALVEVLLSDLMHETSISQEKLDTSYGADIVVPAFKLNDYIVWGATAMMLYEIKELFKQIL